MQRREFLGALAGLAACLSSSGQTVAPRIKAGFLGASYSHAKDKIRIVRTHADFDLIGAADESPEVRKSYPDVSWL
jgi:hypothetical protein